MRYVAGWVDDSLAFWKKVGITENIRDCWEWKGARTSAPQHLEHRPGG
jgi:hypothetical protein